MQVQTAQNSLISNVSFAKQHFLRFASVKPRIFVASDFDYTLIPWEEKKFNRSVDLDSLKNNRDAFNEVKDQGMFAGVTGLGLKSVQQISPYFTGFPPFDFVSTDNGKGSLYVNTLGNSPELWLQNISDSDVNNDWEAYIKEQIKWERDLFFSNLFLVLKENGFEEFKDKLFEVSAPHYLLFQSKKPVQEALNNYIKIAVNPGESAIYIVKDDGVLKDVYKKIGEELSTKLILKCEHSDFKIKRDVAEHENYFYFFFMPDNGLEVNKASVIDFIFKGCSDEIQENIKAGVVLGDSENDAHLKITEIERRDGKKIPFYSIFSGSELLRNSSFSGHPRIEVAIKKGDIGEVFKKVLLKIEKQPP